MTELPQAGSRTSANRWTSNLTGRLDEWIPPEGKAAGVQDYFSTAASIIESVCAGQGFHFHFTASTNAVPLSGPKSIVFVISEESGPPRYTGSVGAVFKCYGAKPVSMAEWFWNHPSLVLSSLAKDAIVWKRALVSRWRWRSDHVRQGKIFPSAAVHHIPLGYHSVPPPDIPPWDVRANDAFFAGSIRKKVGERKGTFHIPNPKEVVRNDLAQALERFKNAKKWVQLESFVIEGILSRRRRRSRRNKGLIAGPCKSALGGTGCAG